MSADASVEARIQDQKPECVQESELGHIQNRTYLVKTVSDALRVRELIKVSILKNAPGDVKEIAFDLARLTKSELIQVIGRQVVLYKKAKEPKILLP